ncbi:uncharacterized protein LOC129581664 [Paramacrobiotus metropolitanus]|uniref:uncharacterized protein LOC129581664 n=1 Tax=Paramacrobiotus metropolitanus TaxID=2943436 RepID=UPI002445B8EA|nr:uncharacterized protein LOC129581664 [Paramacrobiotus metropolitanus]
MMNIGQIREMARKISNAKTSRQDSELLHPTYVSTARASLEKPVTAALLPVGNSPGSADFNKTVDNPTGSFDGDNAIHVNPPRARGSDKPDLSSPLFLDLLQAEEVVTDEGGNHELSFADILLFHSVYSRILKSLPMTSLLSLACTCRDFRVLIRNERCRSRRHRFEWIYRKEFIRHLNMSYASCTMTKYDNAFSRLIRELYCFPEHILVFYSPDIFQYGIRVIDGAHSGTVKSDVLLDNLLKQQNDSDWRVWHFRVFSVIQPITSTAFSSHMTAHELKRFPLWHSEDLVMVFLPTLENVRIRHHPLNFNMLLNVPEFERNEIRSSLFQYLFVIGQRFRPKLVILSIRDLPRNVENELVDFPVIVIASRLFDSHGPEGWMSFSGDGVTVFQVILEVSDKREERDQKIRALHAQLGWNFPLEFRSRTCWIFYFTELWPGGTSKEIPQRDIVTLREVFPNVPIFGGRTGNLMGNQQLPILASFPGSDARSLRLRSNPTIVTVVAFSDS